jgi:hypothetical protein
MLFAIIALDLRPELYCDVHRLQDQRAVGVLRGDFTFEPTEGTRLAFPRCENHILIVKRTLRLPVER